MTTADIEAAANRGNIATADFVIGQVLRQQIIPQFLEDVGACSWRKVYKPITTVAGTQVYGLDLNFFKMHEVYRVQSTYRPLPLKYIGEDPFAVALAETTTTECPPVSYYIVQNGGTSPLTVQLSWSSISDGGYATQSFSAIGAMAGGQINPGWPATLEAGIYPSMVVTANGVVQVRLDNFSGGTITPATNTYTYTLGGTPTTLNIASGSVTPTWTTINDGTIQAQTLAVAGATPGNQVVLGMPPTLEAGLSAIAFVSAAGFIQIRMLNASGAPVTPATHNFNYAITQNGGLGNVSFKAMKLQAPCDAAYSLVAVELTYIPFSDFTSVVDMQPFIPEQLHWGLVSSLRAQIYFDRFGMGDPRYDRAMADYNGWVVKAQDQRELGRRNYFVSVR